MKYVSTCGGGGQEELFFSESEQSHMPWRAYEIVHMRSRAFCFHPGSAPSSSRSSTKPCQPLWASCTLFPRKRPCWTANTQTVWLLALCPPPQIWATPFHKWPPNVINPWMDAMKEVALRWISYHWKSEQKLPNMHTFGPPKYIEYIFLYDILDIYNRKYYYIICIIYI